MCDAACLKILSKKSECRDQTVKYKSHGFFCHFNVEMRTETFSSFSQTEIVLFCLEQVQNKILFAKLYLMGKKSLRNCILLWKKYFDGKLPINSFYK